MKKYLLFLNIICSFLITNHSTAQVFTSSNLPIVVINTSGQYIDSAFQTFYVGMGIIDNGVGVRNNLTDPFNDYNGDVELKLHGSSTLFLPKRSYSISPVDASHNKISAQLFGLPAGKDWVFKALYQDKTFLRDALAFRVFTQMGHYSSRTYFFELVVDGNYKGVYQVEEKVKRDNDRVDISKLKATDIAGDDLTGGYIISLDKYLPGTEGWHSAYTSNITHDSSNYFLYEYPNPDSMPAVQKTYIKNYFDKFESVLASSYVNSPDSGYSKYIDVPSFIDNFITNEISKNVDGYRSSTFFYKDRDSKNEKLHSGPVWDFNLGFDNCSYNGASNTYGWEYQTFSTVNFIPFWWWQFMDDIAFKDQLKCRYQDLRTNILSISSINSYIDSMAIYLNESQIRNFNKWPIMGTAIYPEPLPVPTSYAGEIGNMKWWIQQRLTWMDSHIPGICITNVQENKPNENLITSFPNPCTNNFNISYELKETAKIKIELFNTLGSLVKLISDENKSTGEYQFDVDIKELPSGTYILKVSINNQDFHQKIVKIGK